MFFFLRVTDLYKVSMVNKYFVYIQNDKELC